MTTTYTLIQNSGIATSGLSARDAAIEILSHDGRLYDIAVDGDESRLMVSPHSAASYAGAGALEQAWDGSAADRRPIVEWGGSAAEREERIFARAVAARRCLAWSQGPDVMTDAEYTAMMAEVE